MNVLAPPRRKLTVTTVILGVCAAGAVASALFAVGTVAAADPASQGAEAWRLIGYLMFAGVFVLLARDPGGQRGLWAVTIAAKAALPVAALTFARGADDAATFLVADGLVTALLLIAYLLRPAAAPAGAPRS